MDVIKSRNFLMTKKDNFNEIEIDYDLRHRMGFQIQFIHSLYHGNKSISYLLPKNWDIISPEIKQINTNIGFKRPNRRWILADCSCRFGRIYCRVSFTWNCEALKIWDMTGCCQITAFSLEDVFELR